MTKDEALRLALEALGSNRRTHYYCEDTWYSCPKHEDGCANDSEGDECNCGADEANAEIEQAITAIKATLEAKDEPFEYWNAVEGWVKIDEVRDHFDSVGCGTIYKNSGEDRVPLYTTPPQRKPLTDEEIWKFWWNKPEVPEGEDDSMEAQFVAACRRAIEAAHGITGEKK